MIRKNSTHFSIPLRLVMGFVVMVSERRFFPPYDCIYQSVGSVEEEIHWKKTEI
jgi:hypothetical protein